MTSNQSLNSRAGVWLIICCVGAIAAHVVLVATARLLPMVDIPSHLAAATVMRFWDQPGTIFGEYYRLPPLGPNLLHLWIISSNLFPTVEFANKLFYVATVILLPVSVCLLIRQLNGTGEIGLLAVIFTYHFSAIWGFAGYTIGVPLSIIAVALATRLQSRESWFASLALASVLVVTFFAHAQLAMFVVVALLVSCGASLVVCRTRTWQTLLALLPVSLVLLHWSVKVESASPTPLPSFLLDYFRHQYLSTLKSRLALPLFDLSQLGEGRRAYAIAIIAVLPLGFLLVAGREGIWFRLRAWSVNVKHYPILVFTFGALLAWFILPSLIPGQAFVYERFSILVSLGGLAIIGALTPRRYTQKRSFIALVFVSLSAQLISTRSFYSDWKRASEPITPALFPNTSRERLAAVVCNPMFRDLPTLVHVGDYFTVWKRGIVATPVIDYRFGSIRRAAAESMLPSAVPWFCYERAYDGRFGDLEYLLVEGSDGRGIVNDDRSAVVREVGAWKLYRQSKAIK